MFLGSLGSGGLGLLTVLTEQNLQPLVHSSPNSIMVAVAGAPPFPPQHSPIFGHLASSHTVLSLSPRKDFFKFEKFSPLGISVFNQEGRFKCCPLTLLSSSEDLGACCKKSSKPGPFAISSLLSSDNELLKRVHTRVHALNVFGIDLTQSRMGREAGCKMNIKSVQNTKLVLSALETYIEYLMEIIERVY